MTWLALSEEIAEVFADAQDLASVAEDLVASGQLALDFGPAWSSKYQRGGDPAAANRRRVREWMARHRGDTKLAARRRVASMAYHARRRADPLRYAAWLTMLRERRSAA